MLFLSRPNDSFGVVHIILIAVAILLGGISFGGCVGLIVDDELEAMPDFDLDINLEAGELCVVLAGYPN